jgi:septal ring factor EnvC (AmiA/AmiB activator)
MKRLFLLNLLSLTLLSSNATAGVTATRTQLSNVDQAITQTKQFISVRKNRLENIQGELRRTETIMSDWHAKLAQTKQSLQQSNATINELQTQLTQLHKIRNQQNQALAAQMKAQYMLGEKHPLKILLNNENHANIDRINKYTEILAQRRIDILTSLKKNQELLSLKKAALQQRQDELSNLQQQQQVAHQKLQDQLQQRHKLIAEIDQSITKQENNLRNLVEKKTRLHALVNQLQKSNNYSGEYVSKHHGHLAWPVKGSITTEFGQPIKGSQLRTSGIVIGAKYGNTVRAVAPGKVVFADWMPGLGFMMIIDHGQSYMSLYGHNQRLLLTVGDVVKTGDEISLVGDSGGQPEPGLYFGIRHQGKPINPHDWLS